MAKGVAKSKPMPREVAAGRRPSVATSAVIATLNCLQRLLKAVEEESRPARTGQLSEHQMETRRRFRRVEQQRDRGPAEYF
jgi:hypothetical protein